MQRLVYVFILLTGLGLGVSTYGALAFSAVESATVAMSFIAVAMTLTERSQRRRAEARLDQSIQSLARLLATDAKAGQMLSERVNALSEADYAGRMEAIEADLSVLGAVVRQVAEALADIEEARAEEPGKPAGPVALVEPDAFPDPLIPLMEVRAGIDADRVVMHSLPVQALGGTRRVHGYDLMPRLLRGEDLFADPVEFLPRRGGEDIIRRIDALGWDTALAIARRARQNRQNTRLFVPLSAASLSDAEAMEALHERLDSVELASALIFMVPQAAWTRLSSREKKRLYALRKAGAAFALIECTTLKIDCAELRTMGFTSVRVEATQFLNAPAGFSDFHTADIADFLRRYDIELCLTGIVDEQQLLALSENGIALATGPHIGGPEPVAEAAKALPEKRLARA